MVPDLRNLPERPREKQWHKHFRIIRNLPPETEAEMEIRKNKWLVPPEPSPEDREFVEKMTKDYSAWEEHMKEERRWDYDAHDYVTNQTREWRIRNEADRERYERAKAAIEEYDGKFNWASTRVLPQQYYRRVKHIQDQGVHGLWLRPMNDNNELHALEVALPSHFSRLTNKVGHERKEAEGKYHISLASKRVLDAMTEDEREQYMRELNRFYDHYFHEGRPWDEYWGNGRHITGKHEWRKRSFPSRVTVSSGSTIQFNDMNDPFVRWAYSLQKRGTGKDTLHMSFD